MSFVFRERPTLGQYWLDLKDIYKQKSFLISFSFCQACQEACFQDCRVKYGIAKSDWLFCCRPHLIEIMVICLNLNWFYCPVSLLVSWCFIIRYTEQPCWLICLLNTCQLEHVYFCMLSLLSLEMVLNLYWNSIDALSTKWATMDWNPEFVSVNINSTCFLYLIALSFLGRLF